tara:strand:+ start:96 stop:734 length:639 start_codon:yes stop_codon:yes gene_type:complete
MMVIFEKNRLSFNLFRRMILWAFVFTLGMSMNFKVEASTIEQQRREARVQATYLTHLVNFTTWSEEHLPEKDESPKILVLGQEKNGFVASLEYLISQSNVEVGGKPVEFEHIESRDQKLIKSKLIKGYQVVFLMRKSVLSPQEIRNLCPSAVVFGFGRQFVTTKGGDVAFISERNRVKLILSDQYFRRTSPKLSSKIANLKSVVEIVGNKKN